MKIKNHQQTKSGTTDYERNDNKQHKQDQRQLSLECHMAVSFVGMIDSHIK